MKVKAEADWPVYPIGAGHDIQNVDSWGVYVCVRCGTGRDYAHEPCTGKKQYPCPTMANGWTRGECLETFGTAKAADAHWRTHHKQEVAV